MRDTVIDTFRRIEDKYVLTYEQANRFLSAAASYLTKDTYFHYPVRTVYYDTSDNAFLIKGMEKPQFKMKLRLRGYGEEYGEHPVWIETKKKYGDIVYKRRIPLPEKEALDYLDRGIKHHLHNHTAAEIDYLISRFHPCAKALICYERTCYASKSENDVRLTFDEHISYSVDNISLHKDGTEKELVKGKVLMEIKAMDRYPLWLVRILSDQRLYRQSFSKLTAVYVTEFGRLNPLANSGGLYQSVYIDKHEEKEKRLCSIPF